MNVSIEFEGWNESRNEGWLTQFMTKLPKVFKISDERELPIYKATDILAEERIDSIKNIRGRYLVVGHRFPGRKTDISAKN